jgi:protein TonB
MFHLTPHRPKSDQVKFEASMLSKKTEEPPKSWRLKKKKLGAETIKGDPDAVLSVVPAGPAQLKLLKRTIRFTTRKYKT